MLYNELIIYFFLCHSVGIKLIKLVPQNFYSTYSLQLTLGLMYFKLVKAINLKLNVLVTHTHTHTKAKIKERDSRELWEVLEMSVTLTAAMVSQVFAYVQTIHIVHISMCISLHINYTSINCWTKKELYIYSLDFLGRYLSISLESSLTKAKTCRIEFMLSSSALNLSGR